jgi:3-deoxy-D-manno-octulosonic-acid transferase
MFAFVYYVVATILYIVAFPYLIFKSKNQKYKDAIPSRFFLKNNPKFKQSRFWFHSCSMGETKALKPLFDKLNIKNINLSVITNTGYAQGKEFEIETRYLPYEIFLPFWITKQKALVVMEAELWYMLFLSAKHKNIPTILINARINDKSYETYKKYAFFYRYIFKNIDKIFAQTLQDKQRLEELGATNIEVIGNIKLVSLPKITNFLTKPQTRIITAGSTHETEEELILNSWNKDYGTLVIVPRHPERFNIVFNLIEQKYKDTNITYHRYSQQEDFNSNIILVDKMGILNDIYSISDVVILGGGFIKTAGGHNPIEPAFFNTILISGKTIFNQKALFQCVNNYYLIEPNELESYLQNISNLEKSFLDQQGSIEPILKYLNVID